MTAPSTAAAWLPATPAHWRTVPLWTLFRRVKDVDHPEEEMLSVFRDHGVVKKESRKNLNVTAENRSIYQLVHPGWLVTNRMKAWQGSVGISKLRGIVSGHYICFEPRHRENESYLNWLFRSGPYRDGYALLSRGVRIGQAEIDNDDYRQLPVLLPPEDEQQAIADYLDRETERIDELIGKQQQLIATLRERRGAVIDRSVHQATTNAPLLPLRRALLFLTSGARGWGEYYADSGEKFLRIGNLPRTSLNLRGEVQYIELPPEDTEGERTRLQANDLVLSITAYLGSVAEVDHEWAGAYVSQHVALCRLDQRKLYPRFGGWYMLTTEGQSQLKQGAAGGTKQQLALDDIRGLRVPFIEVREQRRISDHLDQRTAKIDTLISKAEHFIELARERRAALIIAAVTGQIDVREAA